MLLLMFLIYKRSYYDYTKKGPDLLHSSAFYTFSAQSLPNISRLHPDAMRQRAN
jgi:hypothetical protein